jgi:hypothetical protein
MSGIVGEPYVVTKNMFLQVKEQELQRLNIIGPTAVDYVYGIVHMSNPKRLQDSPTPYTIIMGIKNIVCDDIKDDFILKLHGLEKVLSIINDAYIDCLNLEFKYFEIKNVIII